MSGLVIHKIYHFSLADARQHNIYFENTIAWETAKMLKNCILVILIEMIISNCDVTSSVSV